MKLILTAAMALMMFSACSKKTEEAPAAEVAPVAADTAKKDSAAPAADTAKKDSAAPAADTAKKDTAAKK